MKKPNSKISVFFKILLILLSAAPFISSAQVWQEKFDGLTNGATSDAGSTAWSTVSPSGGGSSFSKQTPYTGYELLLVNDTGSEGVWTSQTVNISSYTEIAVEITLYSYFTYSTDYIRCYYKLNGGPEVQFGELLGSDGLSIASAASAIVSGSTLQIVVRGMENTSGSQSGIPRALAFDDVTLSNLKVLYSRQTGDWTDGNTWSTTSLTGSACSCTPDANSRVVIGNSKTVNIPSAVDAAGVTVQNTGVLKYTSNSALTMDRGGSININSGGAVNMNGNTSSSIVYGAYSYSVIVNGTLSTGDITAATGSNISFSGSGSVTLGDDFIISSGSGRTITTNVSGGFTIGDQLSFTSTSSNTAFVNQQALTVTGQINFASGTVAFTNNSTITAGSIVVAASTNNGNKITNASTGSISVGAITMNNGDFTLDNNGTITQTGNFNSIDTGSKFNNLAGSTWNFSGGGTNARLFCNNASNVFNYNAAGAQTIFVPADAYYNLSIAGSGIKTFGGATDINGNLTVAGTSQADASGSNYALSVAGNWTITSTNANPFVERAGTVTFDGTSAQTISTVLGTETFNNLTINKSGGNAQLSSTDAVVTALTLSNGGLDLNGRTLTINSASTTAIVRTSGFIKSESTSAPYGQLKWAIGIGTGSYVFPFAKTSSSSDYVPFTFNVTIAGLPATGTVSVLTYATGTSNTPYPSGVADVNSTAGTDNSANVVDRFWYITLGSYTTNPTATVTFVATPSEVGSITAMRAQRWNSVASKWDPPKSGQTNPTTYSTTVPNVNTFSPWTLAGNSTTLPIELLYFTASLKDSKVNLEWKSAQEINNNFYTVEKTSDLENYFEVGQINGAGTTTEAHYYTMADNNPYSGKSYYRLKQTDYDGKVSYFKYVAVENTGRTESSFSIYPIPVTGAEFTVQFTGLSSTEEIPLQVLNMQGQKVYEATVQADDGGQVTQTLSFNGSLTPGIYVVKAGKMLSMIKKIVVE